MTSSNTIDSTVAQYASAITKGAIAIEQTSADLPGETKQQILLNAIVAGTRPRKPCPLPQVQGIAALINLIVSILNWAGVFGHKSAAPAPPTT